MDRTNLKTTQELKKELLNQYLVSDYNDKIEALKDELHRRGHSRAEIVQVAVQSLIRRGRGK